LRTIVFVSYHIVKGHRASSAAMFANCYKLEFHGTDTDTDILARKSTCPLATSRTRTTTCPTRSLFLARMSVRDARVYTCKRVLYMHTFTKLHDRRIPKVGVGVSPMEFQLYSVYGAVTP